MEKEDFSKEFFERIEKGEEGMFFLSISNAIDAMSIQSYLYSEKIPSHILNDHFASMTNVWNTISPVKLELYILKTDFEVAKNVIKDFNINYKGTLQLYNPEGKIESLNIYREKVSEEKNTTPVNIKTGGFFSLEGTCTLKLFWINLLLLPLIGFTRYFLEKYLYATRNYGFILVEYIVLAVVIIIWDIHLSCLAVQRYRGLGNNPWFFFIPIWGLIGPLFIPSQENQSNNKYIDYKIKYKAFYYFLIIFLAIIICVIQNYNAFNYVIRLMTR